ncbi:lysogenization regulator HflD, partial [Pseudoalteromonas agarivorans]
MNEHQVMALAAMSQVDKQVQKNAQYGSNNEHHQEVLFATILQT